MITLPAILGLSIILFMISAIPRVILSVFFPGLHTLFSQLFGSITNKNTNKRAGFAKRLVRNLVYHSMWAGLTTAVILCVGWIILLVFFWKYVIMFMGAITIPLFIRDMIKQKTILIS